MSSAPAPEGVVIRGSLIEFDSEYIYWGLRSLTDDDLKDLLDALVEGKFTRLKEINLAGNPLSDVSAERIARALKSNMTVTEVNLVSCLSICLLLLQISSARMLQCVTRAFCAAHQQIHD